MEDYIDYLKRYCRVTNLSLEMANRERICRDVGVYYGLTEREMDSIKF